MLIQSTPSRPNSQSTINKLLEKDLKQLIFTLDSNQLISLFRNLQIESQVTSRKQFTKIGLKCSECLTIFQSFQSKGYGRDEHEAMINSIKIIIESMISSSYRIESIKKALKYCSKYKQPLINFSQGNSLLSSANKRSIKKFQGTENIRMTKRQLQYGSFQQSENKENMSIRMNETSELSTNQIDEKSYLDFQETNYNKLKAKKTIVEKSETESTVIQAEQKCSGSSSSGSCLYFGLQQYSEKQIKSLNARIRLLEEENSILKQLLLKGFNKEFPEKGKEKTNE